MSKPVLPITLMTLVEEQSARVEAVFDTGSFYTIVREDKLPPGVLIPRFKTPKEFNTAAEGGRLSVTGEMSLVLTIGEKMIQASALVSSNLSRDMLVGAGTMQMWDISIRNRNDKTKVIVGKDMRDPDITEVV